VQVGIQRAEISEAQARGGIQVEFEAGDEIDVQGVEPVDERLQLGPGPGRHTADQAFAAALAIEIAKLDAVVRLLDYADAMLEVEVRDRAKKLERLLLQIAADLDDRDDLPAGRRAAPRPPARS
jgi:hypothetical protein